MSASVFSPPHLPPPFVNTVPPPTLISQGAEALLYRTHFLQSTHACALKYRPSKPYRHPTLDARLTKHRILSEARTMVRMRKEGLKVPGVLGVDCEPAHGDDGRKGGGGWMMMEWVEGQTAKDLLMAVKEMRKTSGREEMLREEVRNLMHRIGTILSNMHEIGVIHGDLTTSNLMIRHGAQQPNGTANGHKDGHANAENAFDVETESVLRETLMNGEVVLIDFGLATSSIQDEDKAVDLYVLERAFGSTHPEAEDEFKEVLEAYGKSSRGARVVLKRLEDVRLRGRKKSMIG
ncbi:MAG: hypothetical protein Q9195_006904 [Heterodermia aff. obscurata]